MDSLFLFIKEVLSLVENITPEESLKGILGHFRPKYLENAALEC